MAGDIVWEKTSDIPKEGSVSPSNTIRVEVVDGIKTVLNPGDEFYDVIVHPDGSQTDLGKKVFKDSNVEEVPPEELVKWANSDERQNVKLVDDLEDSSKNNTTWDTFNDGIITQAAFDQFLLDDGWLGNSSFGGFDDGGDFF